MKCSKRRFQFLAFFSLFMTVIATASSAAPGQEVSPPFLPDQGLPGEDSSKRPPEQLHEQPPMDRPPPMPPKDPDNIFYYRGNRTYSEHIPLVVKQLNCLRLDEENVIVELVFNQSINPRSVKHNSILINNSALSKDIRFAFNKKGDRIKITVPLMENSFEIKIQNICAFDGSLIIPQKLSACIEDYEEEQE